LTEFLDRQQGAFVDPTIVAGYIKASLQRIPYGLIPESIREIMMLLYVNGEGSAFIL
jgi:hypothetical protein